MSIRILISAVLFAAFTQIWPPIVSYPAAHVAIEANKSSIMETIAMQSKPEYKYVPVRPG